MTHHTLRRFWDAYDKVPASIQKSADEAFDRLKADPRHPSLQFKCLGGDVWSVRVGSGFRALANWSDGDVYWFWIGPHDQYLRQLRQR